MVQVRPAHAGEMGWVLQAAARGAWDHLSGRERAGIPFPAVAGRVEAMVRTALAQPGAGLLVAEESGKLLGYALFYQQPSPFTGHPEAVLADLQVVPDFRRRGVARRLLRSAEGQMQWEGARGCAAVVPLHRQPALRLLTAAGYWPERVLLARPFAAPPDQQQDPG